MNENWPCLKSQKSIATGSLVGSGSGRLRSGTDPNRSRIDRGRGRCRDQVWPKSNRAPRTKNGNDSAQTNKTNDARTKQWPVRPGWWVEWVTRGSRGSEAGRDYDYDHVNGAWRRKKRKVKKARDDGRGQCGDRGLRSPCLLAAPINPLAGPKGSQLL